MNHRNTFQFTLPFILAFITLMPFGQVNADNSGRRYHIPAQSLNNALLRFAADSGVEILFDADKLRGFKSVELDGNLTPAQALSRLLQDTGMSYRFIDAKTVTLEKAPEQLNKVGSTTLKPVNVTATAIRDVKDPYNQDYVLPNATVGTKTDTPIMETP
ncbi:MAG: STN domain-containing protein, partial [Methylobacter sp.]|nr:STN domain-containing protein [Methylobacter sp.]